MESRRSEGVGVGISILVKLFPGPVLHTCGPTCWESPDASNVHTLTSRKDPPCPHSSHAFPFFFLPPDFPFLHLPWVLSFLLWLVERMEERGTEEPERRGFFWLDLQVEYLLKKKYSVNELSYKVVLFSFANVSLSRGNPGRWWKEKSYSKRVSTRVIVVRMGFTYISSFNPKTNPAFYSWEKYTHSLLDLSTVNCVKFFITPFLTGLWVRDGHRGSCTRLGETEVKWRRGYCFQGHIRWQT